MFFQIYRPKFCNISYLYQVRGTNEDFFGGAVMAHYTKFKAAIDPVLESTISNFLVGTGYVFSFRQISTGAYIVARDGRRQFLPNQELGSFLHSLNEMEDSDRSTVPFVDHAEVVETAASA